MSYSKIGFTNNTTPLNATNMNKMDQGIFDVSTSVDNTIAAVSSVTINTTKINIGTQILANSKIFAFTMPSDLAAPTYITANGVDYPLKTTDNTAATNVMLKSGVSYMVTYSGGNFFIRANTTKGKYGNGVGQISDYEMYELGGYVYGQYYHRITE